MSAPSIYVTESQQAYWLATIPAVMGCNASGKTRDEAIANVRRAFRAYVELLDARGVSVEHWKGLDADQFEVGENPPEGPFFAEDKKPLEDLSERSVVVRFTADAAVSTGDALEIVRHRIRTRFSD